MAAKSVSNIPEQSSHHGENNYRDKDRQKFRDEGELVQDRIYVGGLGQEIYERDLYHFFSKFGAVSHIGIITEGDYSKGYGFVTFTCKEVVKRVLEGPEGKNLVLKGRMLRLGAARQRNDNFWGRGQGWRRQQGNYSQAKGPGLEDPSKFSLEGTDAEEPPSDPSQPVDIQPIFNDHLLVDANSYSHDYHDLCCFQGNQVPIYPYSVPSYPLYYPQYPGPDYLQYPDYPPMSVPTYENTWNPTSYQSNTQLHQDASTSITYPNPTPLYPVSYSTSPNGTYPHPYPMVGPQDPVASAGSYWPQSPEYPTVLYNSGQPTPNMVQYTYTGETHHQPVVGYQESAPVLQDSYAYQEFPNVTLAHEDENSSGYTDARELGDSGFQDTTGGYQDNSSSYQDHQSSTQHQNNSTDRHQVHTPAVNNRYQDKNEGTTTALKQNNSPKKTGQQNSLPNLNKEQPKFTKLRLVEDNRCEESSNSPRDSAGNFRPGRDSRVFPSPYKSFAPFTGNPSPRHFPFPSGPRPYYPSQAQNRGRGRQWGYNNSGSRGGNGGRSILKKKQGKKEPAVKEVVPSVVLSGNQPDILQGPMENLEIK